MGNGKSQQPSESGANRLTGGGQPTVLHWANPPQGQPYPTGVSSQLKVQPPSRQSGRETSRRMYASVPPDAGNPMARLPPASRQGGNRGRGFRLLRFPSLTNPPYTILPPLTWLYAIPPLITPAIHLLPPGHSPLLTPVIPSPFLHVIPSVAEESRPSITNPPTVPQLPHL